MMQIALNPQDFSREQFPIKTIISDTDIDGVICAVIAKRVYPDAEVMLADATLMNSGKMGKFVNQFTLIADLKYLSGTGLYFDHHPGNIRPDVQYFGCYQMRDSAAHIMYDFFKMHVDLSDLEKYIIDCDSFDSGKFSLEKYLHPDDFLKFAFSISRSDQEYITKLIEYLIYNKFSTIFALHFVQQKITSFYQNSDKLSKYIKEKAEIWHNFIFLDASEYSGQEKLSSYHLTSHFPFTNGVVVFKRDHNSGRIKVRLYANSFNQSRKEINYLNLAKSLSSNAGGHVNSCGYVLSAESTVAFEIIKIKAALK
ncbi:MAG: hypothetical protein WCJ58_02935 [bacterium]